MKKLIVYILWILTACGVTYAGFQVINWETILGGRLVLQWSWIVRDDIQNLQLWDTDTVWDRPTLTTISGSTIKTRCFNAADMMYGNVEIPHDMYTWTGSLLSPHIHYMWSTTSATTTWLWFLDYTIRKAWTIYSTTTRLTWTVYWFIWWQAKVLEFDWIDLDASWLYLWDTISFRIRRDSWLADDTYAGSMCLSQIWRHYQRDTMWSRQEYIK